jgi:hypothetical protein
VAAAPRMMEDGRLQRSPKGEDRAFQKAHKTQKGEPDGVRSGLCPAWAVPLRASVKQVCLHPSSTPPGLLAQAPHPVFH